MLTSLFEGKNIFAKFAMVQAKGKWTVPYVMLVRELE